MLKTLPLVLLALALIAGCRKSVVATYTAPSDTGTLTLTLYGDSTFELGPFTTSGHRTMSLRGTYTAKGNERDFTINSVGAFSMPYVNKGMAGGNLSSDGQTLYWNGTTFRKA